MNKRARDQLAAFTEQRDTIGRKMAEVNRSRDSIVDMMRQLEQQKDELLNRTFKQARRRRLQRALRCFPSRNESSSAAPSLPATLCPWGWACPGVTAGLTCRIPCPPVSVRRCP